MERSEPFDAWDDGDDDRRDDDRDTPRDYLAEGMADMATYGPAPLPAHERTWRHPSEMGQAAWMLTEPPVAIGRGLLVTTGAIGCVLGVAVLWLLVPIGGGLAPSAGPTVTSSFAGPRTVVTASTPAPAQTDLLNDSTTAPQQTFLTLPSEEVPVNTVLVTRPATPDTNAIAVAVGGGDTSFMVTTANAVADTEGFSITGTGDPSDGSIVAIDGNLAFISSPDQLDVVGFSETGSAHDGDMVMVLGQVQTPVHFVDEGAVVELDAALVREGTPVIDESGALVALCTLVQGTDGSYVALVPIASPPPSTPVPTEPSTTTTEPDQSTSTTTTVPDTSTSTTVAAAVVGWAGISFGDVAGTASPLLTKVYADSPAATAGMQPGDLIKAVDGAPVTRVDEVFAAIKAKAPGATIVFTVVSGSSPPTDSSSTTSSTVAPVERSISVVLAVYEPAV